MPDALIRLHWQRQRDAIKRLEEMTMAQAGTLPPEAVASYRDALEAELGRLRLLLGKLGVVAKPIP